MSSGLSDQAKLQWTVEVIRRYRHSMARSKRRQAKSRDGMIVTTIALSDDVHRRLSIAAIERNTVMTELVRQAVDAWLVRSEKRPKGRPRVERT